MVKPQLWRLLGKGCLNPMPHTQQQWLEDTAPVLLLGTETEKSVCEGIQMLRALCFQWEAVPEVTQGHQENQFPDAAVVCKLLHSIL